MPMPQIENYKEKRDCKMELWSSLNCNNHAQTCHEYMKLIDTMQSQKTMPGDITMKCMITKFTGRYTKI